jgi:hypothetical protein
MRLTLRTMLAYLDEVLEPADAQDIGKKIEESEFAANIVHRTRDVMRRLRLGAPKLSGRGMGLDPNTVAEYLDNTLAEDRVADFEKVCLESDVHLAEVASCHQILTLVLDQPADVDPASRQRMYAVPERAEKLATAAAVAATVSESSDLTLAPPEQLDAPVTARPERRKPEVPEYLRKTADNSSWWGAAAIAALAVAFIAVLIMAIGVDEGSWLGQKLGFGTNGSQAEVAQAPVEGEADATAADDTAGSDTAANDAAGDDAAAKSDALKQPDEVALPKKKGDGDAALEPPLPGETATAATTPAANASSEKTADKTADESQTTTEPGDAPAVILPPAVRLDAGKNNATASATSATEPAKTAAATPTNADGTPKPADAPVDSVGRLVSNGQVLLRFDAASGNWQRLPPLQTVLAGERLASLPTYRSSITLVNGVNIELLGDTVAAIDLADGVPGLQIGLGRVVVLPAGKPDTQLRVGVGQRQAIVTFVDPAATLALEVRPVLVPGANPEAKPSPLLVELYAASGKFTWQDLPGGKVEEVAAPMRVSLGAKGAAGTALPDWLTAEKLTNSERLGAEFASEYLAADRPTMLGLAELAEHRRGEVRALGLSSLCLLGRYEPTVTALNQVDATQRNLWEQLIMDLREAIARSPEDAAAVRTAFEKHRGEAAKELYRMLWGYTPEQFAAGSAAKLVEYLDHTDMDFRALAFWNLREMTDQSLNYRPELGADLRKPYIQKWKQRLTSGQLLPKE